MPLPFWASEPLPEMAPAKVTSSLRLKARAALLVTLPANAPDVPPLPICSVPAATMVPPEWVAAPVRISVPLPFWVSVPAPEMAPAKVTSSVRLKTRPAPEARTTSPLIAPVVPALPICSVPPVTVVPPV